METAHDESLGRVLKEEVKRRELQRVFRHFTDEKLPFLTLKGTPYAYQYYPEPHLRVREDTDILVHPLQKERFFRELLALGYVREPSPVGEWTRNQAIFYRKEGESFLHVIDLHWALFERQALKGIFPFEELLRNSIDVPALGCRTPKSQYAIAISCLHWLGHHPADENPLWYLDLHLILGRMSDGEITELIRLMFQKQILGVVAEILLKVIPRFKTQVTPEFLGWLQAIRNEKPYEELNFLLNRNRTWASELYYDLKFVPSWLGRLQFLKEHAFPSRDWVGGENSLQLVYQYARRIFLGIPKLLRQRA